MTVAQKTTHFICLRTTDSITYGHSYCVVAVSISYAILLASEGQF